MITFFGQVFACAHMRKFELGVNLLEIQDEKMSYSSYHACNITQAAVYVIDFKCEPEAYDVCINDAGRTRWPIS